MDSTVESKAFRPCMHQDRHLSSLSYSHHHHHHFHVLPHCPFHGNMILHSKNHSPVCPLFNFHPRPLDGQPESKQLESGTQENLEVEQEGEEDPVFVLTDEWAEFFAKSEAKRRQVKKQAKRKGKKEIAESTSHK